MRGLRLHRRRDLLARNGPRVIVISLGVTLRVLRGSGNFRGAALSLSPGRALHFKEENGVLSVDTTVLAISGRTAERRDGVPHDYKDRSCQVACGTILTRLAFSDALSTASSAEGISISIQYM